MKKSINKAEQQPKSKKKQPKQTVEDIEEKADQAFFEEQFDLAIQLYKKSIEMDLEKDYEIDGLGINKILVEYKNYYYLSEWYQHNKIEKKLIKGTVYDGLSLCITEQWESKAHIQWYKEMIDVLKEQGKTNYQLELGLGHIYLNNGKKYVEEAVDQYKKVLKIKPTFYKAYQFISLAYFYGEKQKQCKQWLEQSLKYNISSYESLIMKSSYLEDDQRKEEQFLKICQENQGFSDCYLFLAELFEAKNQIQKAEKTYLKGLSINKNNENIYINLSQLYLKENLMGKSQKIILKFLQKNQKSYRSYHQLGSIYEAQTRIKLAKKNYEKAIQIRPNYLKAHIRLADTYNNTEEFQTGIEILNNYLKKFNNERAVQVHQKIGDMYNRNQENVKAIDQYTKCIELDSNYSEAYFGRALCEYQNENIEKAKMNYEKCLQINPQHVGSIHNLGTILQDDEGKVLEAIECYKKSLKIKNIKVLHKIRCKLNMVSAYLALRNYEEVFDFMVSIVEELKKNNFRHQETEAQEMKEDVEDFAYQRNNWLARKVEKKQYQEVKNNFMTKMDSFFDQ